MVKFFEVQFLGGPQDGMSFAFTQDDLPLDSVIFKGVEKYTLNSFQLNGWGRSRFVYLHDSLNVLDLNLVEN